MVPETLLEKHISFAFLGLLGAEGPRFLSRQELLFQHGRSVGALRSVTIDENVAHESKNVFDSCCLEGSTLN